MDIKELRDNINGIDVQLRDLFLKRMELSRGIAEYKRKNNLPIRDSAREQEILKAGGIYRRPYGVFHKAVPDKPRLSEPAVLGRGYELYGRAA